MNIEQDLVKAGVVKKPFEEDYDEDELEDPATHKFKKHPRLKSQENVIIQTIAYIWIGVTIVFSMFPLFLTIINSMKSNSAVATSIYTLPDANIFKNIAYNYSAAFNYIKKYMLNSIIISFVASFFNALFASILAYIFTRKQFFAKEFIFSIYIIILLVPSILGMSKLYPLMAETFHLKNSFFAIWLPVIGGGQAGALFLFRTFFGQIPSDLYESAKIDGANDVTIYLKITVPLCLPILLLNFVGTFSAQYNDYLWASLILEQGKQAVTPMLYVLSDQLKSSQQAVLYAVYLVASLPLIVTTALSLNKFQSGEFASGMKL